MTALEAALVELATALERIGVPYVVIGGLAVVLSGEPRVTLDVDVSVWVDPERLHDTVGILCERFRPLRPEPVKFVERFRVLPIAMTNGIRADVVFAAIPAEREMIQRAVWKNVGNKKIPVASVEDLLFMKLISTREKGFIGRTRAPQAVQQGFGSGLSCPQVERSGRGVRPSRYSEKF